MTAPGTLDGRVGWVTGAGRGLGRAIAGALAAAGAHAGISPDFTRSERVADRQWRHVLDVNLTGTFHCCRAAGRVMLDRASGSIVNVSSVHATSGAVPVGRVGDAAELAGAAVFLVGDGARYMTGSTMTVDGGWTAR